MPSSSRFSSSVLTQLETSIHGVIKDSLGFSDPNLLQAALNTIQEGGEEKDIKSRLSTVLDSRKASKLAMKIWTLVDDFCVSHDLPLSASSLHRKRKARDDLELASATKVARAINKDLAEQDAKEAAAAAAAGIAPPPPTVIPASAMTADEIRSMMSNTLKQIEQRKRQLGDLKGNADVISAKAEPPEPVAAAAAAAAPAIGKSALVGPQKPMPAPPSDKAATIAALQAQIASRLDKVGVKIPVPDRPTPVILNDAGQTVDSTGQAIQLSHHIPTLKANLRAKKRDELKEHLKDVPSIQMANQESKFFDQRVMGKQPTRARRTFKFNDPGKFQMEGNRIRMKAKLEQLQADISTIARKTGITSATQLAKLVPKETESGKMACPDVEWWDAHIMKPESTYNEPEFRESAISNLIEHPIQMMPLEPAKSDHVAVFLTKKERKKLRRQNRREAWKEKQDKIRLGLVAPDDPKVKMSNLMRVLGNEAVQDPTKVEAHVREQMAKRLANHEKANADRKLTPEQRKEKNCRKMKEDTSCGVKVAVYRVKSLSNPSKKFKVETNANQLYMTGAIVLYEDVNVVVVEGGPKQHKKYKHLMLNRIPWAEETYQDKDGQEVDNACVLVWEGETKERHFGEMRLKLCPTESFARDYFKNQGVEHYWDQAYSAAVLEASEAI